MFGRLGVVMAGRSGSGRVRNRRQADWDRGSAMKKVYCSVVPLVLWPFGLCAQLVIDDDLSMGASRYPWLSIGGACLTAGRGGGSIPSCRSLNSNFALDPLGHGALRLTSANQDQAGGVISTTPFHSNQGLQVTFTSVTYGGNGFGGTGADGMSFFLIDGDRVSGIRPSTHLGSSGGSLGYSRSRGGVPGIQAGYLGVGIDEYGNFSNPEDNGVGGPGFVPNVVALRGAQTTDYRYVTGSRVLGNIASTGALRREDAVPITFNLNITSDGLLSMAYSRQGGVSNPVITNHSIAQSNGRMPSRFYFGFAGSTGAGTNIHEITCFKAAGITTSGSSSSSNVLQSAKVQQGTQLYRALYHSKDWWGQLVAQDLMVNPLTHSLSINPIANWDAHCTLTGGRCQSTGGRVTAQPSNQRMIWSFNGATGMPFRWAQLSEVQREALGDASSTVPPRYRYLRGDRSRELPGGFRTRAGVLGDIVNSSPTWVGPPQQPYTKAWVDALYPEMSAPEGDSYRGFARTQATRTNVVYVGANDGMLHGFRAGAYRANGTFNTRAPNDGRELLAYMPSASVMTLHSPVAQLDYSHPQYAHNAFVDATPGVGDLFYGGAWHTWLVSGLGAGGNPGGVLADDTSVGSGSIFALDITNPA